MKISGACVCVCVRVCVSACVCPKAWNRMAIFFIYPARACASTSYLLS